MMGFPGGKPPKTIVLDLSEAFPGDDYRLRIATSMEMYWDQIFFTVDEPAAEVKIRPLALTSADLHYRGFSRCDAPDPKQPQRPERYDYQDCSPRVRWAPIAGRFTRYGDVKELLTVTDDRMAVMGPGDEITLRFDPGDPPPPGWKRDFLLHNVGWEKDADANTFTSSTSEPLPFQAMKRYPPLQSPPDSKEYREYLRRYQIRRTPQRRK